MDLSAKPAELKISYFEKIKIEKANNQILTPSLEDTMSAFPVWKLDRNSNIFIFSISCGDSIDRYIKDILPRIQKGESFLLANFLRHDGDLNVWTRIFKLKLIFRIVLVTKIFQDSYNRGKHFSMDSIHNVIDAYLSSVPLEQVYSGYDTQQAAVSGILTTVALQKVYNVTATPVVTMLK